MRAGSSFARARLSVECLEAREVPATLAPISDFTTPNTKALFVPLTVTNAVGTVTYTATSTDPQVQVQVVAGGTTIRLHVTGKDASNANFEGDLTFRLFDTLAPITTARIVTLVNQGFYDGLTFHRIIDGFVAQGGDLLGTGSGGSGTKIDDEFNTLLTFNSPGLLAMANSGDDTGDSQFFITDTDLTLAQQPQHLNFNHTIFGQLVSGFETFTKLMSTPVNNPSSGSPLSAVTIVAATVVSNDPNGVLRVTAPANYTGTAAITVTPSDDGASTGDTFNVGFVADTRNEPPFLGAIANQTTPVGTGVTFQLTATDLENDALTYSVISATSGGQAVNLSPRINQTTGRVTLTPPAGFVGVVNLTVGVKDAGGVHDTQVITLTVAGSFDLRAADDTGVLNDDNITGAARPTLIVLAPAGRTVTVSVNGSIVGTATATATAGQYQITLPAGRLKVGANTITGTVNDGQGGTTALIPFTLTYAPSLKSVYVVPGDIGTPQQVAFTINSSQTAFRNELGFFKADDASGTIGNLKPGDAGYFAAAMARRQVVFARGATAGATATVTANGGDILVMFLVQNSTTANLLATNPTNSTRGTTTAFFSLTGINPDRVAHVAAADDPLAGQAVYGWEDLTGGGDMDFNDVVVAVRRTADAALTTLQVPAGPGRTAAITAQLATAKKPTGATGPAPGTTAGGEVGFFSTDTAAGAIGGRNPGSVGYVAAALARARILFSPTAPANTSISLPVLGGQFLVMYYVPNGTAAAVLASNPNNTTAGTPKVFFSLQAANPDGQVHARSVDPEGVARTAPTATDPLWFHMMGKMNGGLADFDDVRFSVRFVS